MKREFLQNIKVGDQPLPKEAIDSILNEHSRSIGTIKAEKESLATQLQTAKTRVSFLICVECGLHNETLSKT